MTKIVTLELSEDVARGAREVAARTDRRLEEVLVEWLDHMWAEQPIEMLPDDQVLALAEQQMTADENQELSDLLARNREGTLDEPGRARLDELMQVYRRGLVRKARALKVAVERGLRPPLSSAA